MKFPRTVKVFQGRPDAAPYAGVLFLLVMFVLLGTLVYTPGVKLELPVAGDLPGIDQPTIAVAIDAGGRLYYENQLVQPNDLKQRLRTAIRKTPDSPALLVQADKAASYEAIVKLTVIARDAGVKQAFLATLPRDETPAELKP